MGQFEGSFQLNRSLTLEEKVNLQKFSESERLYRESSLEDDPLSQTIKIITQSEDPSGEFSCPQNPNNLWREGEKLDNYLTWLNYLIVYFLRPWGYLLSGKITYQEENQKEEIYLLKNRIIRLYPKRKIEYI